MINPAVSEKSRALGMTRSWEPSSPECTGPFGVSVANPANDVAHEVHHVPLTASARRH